MNFLLRLLSTTVCLSALMASISVSGQVFINEIMYYPAPVMPENPAHEWIELYNSGTQSVDLNGWKLDKGISYTFTNIAVPAGGYLIVAANPEAFLTNYPGTAHALGGWTGKLRNSGETIRLQNAAGQKVDEIAYADEGDWALRREGEIYPGKPSWWRGWRWFSPASGGGASLELMNPGMDRDQGQNWKASLLAGGTPGKPNSVATNNIPPCVLDLKHFPAIPKSTDPVTVTVTVRDEAPAPIVELHHRIDGASDFTITPMKDDGLHNDGLAGDNIFGLVLPAQPNRTVVEFYVRAIDSGGRERTWPGATDRTGSQGANALYQVDDSSYAGSQPVYRFIVTSNEWSEWYALMDSSMDGLSGRYSDATMNATVVRSDGTGTLVRYRAGLRNRGAGTRAAKPHNLHLAIPADNDIQGVTKLNFNTRTVHSQVAGNAVFTAAGLLNAYGAPVQVRVNGINQANATPTGTVDSFQFGSYYCFEPYDSDWAAAHIPGDPDGNIYRGCWYLDGIQLAQGADLEYLGTNVAKYKLSYGTNGPNALSGPYEKANNRAEDEWSDLVSLTFALSTNTPASNYLAAVGEKVNVEQWLRHFAANSLILNMETTLATGDGDDYSAYRGIIDPRFQLLNHDNDTVLGQGENAPSWNRSIFKAAELPVLDRLLKHPEVAPRYFAILKELAESLFSAPVIGQLLDDQLKDWVPANYIQSMKDAAERRRTNVLSQIPQQLTATSQLGVMNGYFRTTAPTAALSGTANAITTRSIKVNGLAAAYVPWQGAWSIANVPLLPGINRLLVQALNVNGDECGRTYIDIWFDDGSVTTAGGTLSGNTSWLAANGPYKVSSALTVPAGVTLTIEPGATVYFGSGVNMVVANGGRLIAEGTATAPIRFSTAPGSAVTWGGLIINGSVGSPESRIAHAFFEKNGSTAIQVTAGTLDLSYTSFGNTAKQYLSVDGASFRVSHCFFPTVTAALEPVHGTLGVKTGGRGIFQDCFFGAANGYNDVVDFTGGNRNLNQPIVQFYNNVFVGSGDDLLDLDGTDAWIEGNIFLNVHRNGAPDSSAAVSGGNSGGDTSEVTIIGNIFFNCDHAVTAKQGNFYTLINNTIVRVTNAGGQDSGSGVVNLRDTEPTATTAGAGVYLEGNIVVDALALVRNYDAAQSVVTFTNNLLPSPWNGPGGHNLTNAPQLTYIPKVSEAQFNNWDQAQIIRNWFSLRPGSPGAGTGPNGRDMGGIIPMGISVSGEPPAITSSSSAEITVGTGRTGHGIPAAGFPAGSGYTHYKWRLDGAAWSPETPIAATIQLSNLSDGPHSVEVTGRRDSGWYQDSAELDGAVTASRTWTVQSGLTGLRINEVLARNNFTFVTNGESPDLIELYNPGRQAVDLSGKGLTDDPAVPYKYTFPSGTSLDGCSYLILIGDVGPDAARFTGFGLNQQGDSLFLFAAPAEGGALLDALHFGPQLPDYSVGRSLVNNWVLCRPTFGSENTVQPVASPLQLRLNEWLASGSQGIPDDFVEVYNPEPAPVDMGGLYLSDAPNGDAMRHQLPSLSFIAPYGFFAFKADGNTSKGAEHLNFNLSSEAGGIGLFTTDLKVIDRVFYGPQSSGISEGRSPNGSETVNSFIVPTPGAGNPSSTGSVVVITDGVPLLQMTNAWRYSSTGTDLGVNWRGPTYNDSAWPAGQGLLGREPSSPYPYPVPIATLLPLTNQSATFITTHYFRTRFEAPADLTGFTVDADAYLDDGAVFYLNGNEVARVGMPAGTISHSTLATNAAEGVLTTINIPASALTPGTNTLAVEVHQTSIGSSDLVFGMAMAITRTTYITNMQGLVLSEVFAANGSVQNQDGTVTDLVEINNPGPVAINLGGYSLTDNIATARKWVFPSGATIPAGGRLVIRCDSTAVGSVANGPVLNTGFGLDAQGDSLYLFDPAITLVDSVSFGPQAADFSIARLPEGSANWTIALPTLGSVNVPAAVASPAAVKINEWAASVNGGPDWFELYNPAPQPVEISGLFLTDKLGNRIKHQIAPLSFVGVNTNGYARFIADSDTAQGPSHVNFSLDGTLGEAIGLFPPGTSPAIDTVVFGPQASDVSEGRLPDGAESRFAFRTPSPGEPNWVYLDTLYINEVLTHTDLPLEDAVELYNASEQPVDISGWYLSDSSRDLLKFKIPNGTIVPAGGYKVFYEYQFNADPFGANSFSFSSAKGDEVWLTACDANGVPTGYRDYVTFGPQYNGVSFGRVMTSTGPELASQSALSFGTTITRTSPTNQLPVFRTGTGATNAGPKVGPIVISEIMYCPPPVGTNENTGHEYIELHNLSGSTVPLFDPAHPTNRWKLRKGVDFDFKATHSIPPGGFLVVVGFNPATNGASLSSFRTKYGTNALLVGPWSGKLANSGEPLELLAPDAPQTSGPDIGFVPYVLVDKVNYSAQLPWPTNAVGTGKAIKRVLPATYGNEPLNWMAAAATPGKSGITDTDGDGMPDNWEEANGFDKLKNDANLDFDKDGYTNLQEYQAGTGPKDSTSYLQLKATADTSGNPQLNFLAVAGQTYSILYRNSHSEPWRKLMDVAASTGDEQIIITEPSDSNEPARFYRLVTPMLQ